MPGPRARRLEAADERPLAGVLAEAFLDNPLNRAVVGPDPRRRLRANRAGMRATLAAARIGGAVWVAAEPGGDPVGGLIAIPPGQGPIGPPPAIEQLRVWIGQGPRVALRWARVFDTLQGHRPDGSGHGLGLLGVAPRAQGRGIGQRLLGHWLEAVDADGAAAYLETDRPELVRFYGRFGFEPIDATEVFGVPVRFLRRSPARREAGTSGDVPRVGSA